VRRTKIVATLGPACDSRETLAALLDAGMDVARLGLAHGTLQSHLARIDELRALAQKRDRVVGILADLPGPKLRAGGFPNGGVFLVEGDEMDLVPGEGESSGQRIVLDGPRLNEVIRPGEAIVIGDGAVTLEAVDVRGDGTVRATVRSAGRLQGSPGVHFPAARWTPPVPTDADRALIERVARLADWVALSFVHRADELVKARELLGERGPRLIAKIETKAAVDHLDELLGAADGVMVARGDLGIDLAIEDVPYLQKRIIGACVDRGIPVITATQMLESMVNAPRPTRAEVTDVANAVYDGSDALMLSGETAIGQHPVQTVRTMARIALRAEQVGYLDDQAVPVSRVRRHPRPTPARASGAAVTLAMTRAAGQAAAELEVDAIVCCTRSGRTARAMAGLRPRSRLIGASPFRPVANQLALSWGVEPMVVAEYDSTDDLVWHVNEAAVNRGLLQHGDTVAVLAGAPDSPTHRTDVLRVVTLQ
jgi:pyruvate kinase